MVVQFSCANTYFLNAYAPMKNAVAVALVAVAMFEYTHQQSSFNYYSIVQCNLLRRCVNLAHNFLAKCSHSFGT